MFKAIKHLFAGQKETLETVEAMSTLTSYTEQETLNTWYKVLSLHYGQKSFCFVVNYSKEEMVKISHEKIEVENHDTEFVFILNEETIVDGTNLRRITKLLTALYKYYRKDNEVSREEQLAFEKGQTIVFN